MTVTCNVVHQGGFHLEPISKYALDMSVRVDLLIDFFLHAQYLLVTSGNRRRQKIFIGIGVNCEL